MKIKNIVIMLNVALSFVVATPVFAGYGDDGYTQRVALSKAMKKMKHIGSQMPLSPPSGVSGIYALPEKSQYITGVNYQHHEFSGLLQSGNSISAQQTVLTAPNQFFGSPGQPSTLRVVPKSAKADVILPFINYTIDEKVSLVALVPLIKKQSRLETFQGGNPNVSLGVNAVKSSGLGDVKFGALYKAYVGKDYKNNVVIDAILSAPTGSITEADTNLTPAGAMVDSRLGYGMQLGSGTWNALLGAAYWGKDGKWGYGAQYLATIPLESKNSEGWRYGDKHELTAWGSYLWHPALVSSLRLRGEKQDQIKGLDAEIFGPGLGAQTANYGGTIVEVGVGINWTYAPAKNISIEYSVPISQNRNGYQADKDSAIMISWRLGVF